MQNRNDCLNEAMFLASESYSGSRYENNLFDIMEKGCDGETVAMRDDDAGVPARIAA